MNVTGMLKETIHYQNVFCNHSVSVSTRERRQ